jgi:hypothetical protein
MAVMATSTRFEGGAGAWYSSYTRYPFFAERAAWVAAQTPASNKIGVAGCGWGFLVDELVVLEREAYGFDAASYATAKAGIAISTQIAQRIVTANTLTRTQMTSFRTNTAKMSGATLIPLVVTEDLLPCLTNAEVTTALAELRRIASKLCHIVTCARPASPGSTTVLAGDLTNRLGELNWKTHAGWKALVGSDLIMDAEAGAVL